MSKLIKIKQSLETNQAILIAGVHKRHSLLGAKRGIPYYSINFYVFPKDKGLYTGEELKKLTMGLVLPDLKPIVRPPSSRDFLHTGNSRFYFGQLEYKENVGKQIVEVRLETTDPDLNLEDKLARISKDITREINVIVCPDKKIAIRAYNNDWMGGALLSSNNIRLVELEAYLSSKKASVNIP